jgi:tetratricopeptide (TPR) repeat protein
MQSLVTGYEYDIFISYRQKDNKGERWVSEFVKILQTELESTFKEEISLYFDINPHDGLLETHEVGESLSDKLKCLIFIPIISRTYCDPKSFAWEHEFKAFINQASGDRFGLKVKLPNGNVASRVLPIRIHDLDQDDINLCESALGGTLRGIEFIYKSPGVNRPLRSIEENPGNNQNNTVYRDQINKVANAIKDIIYALKAEPVKADNSEIHEELKPEAPKLKDDKQKKTYFNRPYIRILAGIILILLIITGLIAYPGLYRKDKLKKLRTSDGRISVVVMPFQNMTNDSTWNIWQDGIQFNLVASLSNSPALKVMQAESTNDIIKRKGFDNYALITPSVARTITSNLNASVFIYGNINAAGGKIRISAQLIDTKTAEIFKSFQMEGLLSGILQMTDSLASSVKSYLILSSLKKEIPNEFNEFRAYMPSSVEAFKSFILGYKSFINGDNQSAAKWFIQAIKLDSGYVTSYIWLSLSYANMRQYGKAEECARKVYNEKDKLSFELKIWANWIYAKYVEKSKVDEAKYAKQLLELNDQVPIIHFLAGSPFCDMHQFNNAIPEFETALKIYESWGTKPINGSIYETLINCYHETGSYREEKELLKKALEDFPDDLPLIRRQIISSLADRDTTTANQYFKKAGILLKDNFESDAEMEDWIAEIYSSAGMPDKAENHYRKAVALQPGDPGNLNRLAYFLIDKNINVREGMELIDRAFKLNPSDTWQMEQTRGWGLHKLGKNKEALEILSKCWDNRPDYSYTLYSHLEEVRNAVQNQK